MFAANLIVMALAAGALGSAATVVLQRAFAPRITSAESHAVWNYIVENGLRAEMEARFNEVNGNWPPTKADMAQVMYEARIAADSSARTATK